MVRAIGYRRWSLAGVAAMLVAAAWVSGAISPHLTSRYAGVAHVYVDNDDIGRPNGTEVAIHQTFDNDGWLPVTITGVGVPAGDDYTLRTVRAEGGGFPRTIPPGGSVRLALILSVADCAVVKDTIVPVVFEVDRWWGRATAEVAEEDETEPPWMPSCE